jgi:protein-tyrosine phosphatase
MCQGNAMASVIFICTGNICRSPSAAGLLQQRLIDGGWGDVTVTSAGTMSARGGPPDSLVAEAQAFGLDLQSHQPRRVEASDIAGADVVIGMARQHLREAVVLDPPSFPKSFSLREFTRRAASARPRSSGQSLKEWLSGLHVGRRHIDLIGDALEDDIADPMGGSSSDYRAMLEIVDSLTSSLYTSLWGSVSP